MSEDDGNLHVYSFPNGRRKQGSRGCSHRFVLSVVGGRGWCAGTAAAPSAADRAPSLFDLRSYFSEQEDRAGGLRFARPQARALGLARAGVGPGGSGRRRPPHPRGCYGRCPRQPVAGRPANRPGPGPGSRETASPSLPRRYRCRRLSRRPGGPGWTRGPSRGAAGREGSAQGPARSEAGPLSGAGGPPAIVWSDADGWPQSGGSGAGAGSVVFGAVAGKRLPAPVVLGPDLQRLHAPPGGQYTVRRSWSSRGRRGPSRSAQVYSVDAQPAPDDPPLKRLRDRGSGPTKRVVLFDTLLDRYSP